MISDDPNFLGSSLEPFQTVEYSCRAVEKGLGENLPTVVKEGTMSQSRIAEWSYYLACGSAAVAIIYRAFWFGSLGARLFGAPRVVPHNFVDLSILLFVVSIASNARAMVHR